MKTNSNPLFIVFEGIDGSGKSTQSDLLYTHALKQGFPVIKNVEPTCGPWGEKIRAMLQGDRVPNAQEQLELFIKDREDDVTNTIGPALNNNKIIVMDRYYYSNAAYQGAAGLDPALIIAENEQKLFPKPDRVYLIDITPQLALKRISVRNNEQRDIFEKESYLEKVRANYHIIKDTNFMIIDGSLDKDSIFTIICNDFNTLYNR